MRGGENVLLFEERLPEVIRKFVTVQTNDGLQKKKNIALYYQINKNVYITHESK